LSRIQFGPWHIESFRQRSIELGAKALLIFVESMVHLPELALRAGEFRCLGGTFGFRMGFAQWKIAKHESETFAEKLLNLFHDWIGLAACGALKIAVLHKRYRRVFWTVTMVR
jgi:hypothetical protein